MKTKSKVLPIKSGALSVDEILPYVGEIGRFQLILEILFCIIIVPQTFPVLIMYFAALNPDWKCSANSTICTSNQSYSPSDSDRCSLPRHAWEYTKPDDYSIVTQFDLSCDREWLIHMSSSIFFIGWGVGAVVLGWVADNYGRRIVLFPSLAMLFLTGFVTAFSPDPAMFVIMRLVSGFFVPGTGVQMFILSSELVGHRYRPLMGIGLWFFWTAGLCFLGLQAYFIRTWKILYIVCTIPYIVFVIFHKFVPESIRWLNIHGRIDEAMTILKRVAKWNKKEIPVDVTLASPSHGSKPHKTNPIDLFRTWHIAMLTLVQGYSWFVNGLVYYGLSLAADDLGGSLYVNYVLASMVEFPAVVLAIVLCNYVGRKKTIIIPMLVSGIACALVAFIPKEGDWKIFRISMGIFGKFCVTLAFDAIYTWSVEIYPTTVRAEGMGFLQVTSRLGAATAPWVAKGLSKLHYRVPFVTMGTLAFIAGIMMFYLPETKGKATAETQEPSSEPATVEDDQRLMKRALSDEEV